MPRVLPNTPTPKLQAPRTVARQRGDPGESLGRSDLLGSQASELRPLDAATASQVDEATYPGSRDSLRPLCPGQGLFARQPRRLPRVIRAAIKTRLALSRPACTVLPASYPRSGVWMRAWSSSVARRLPLAAPDAGLPGRQRPGEDEASGESRCSPGWAGQSTLRSSILPLRLRRARADLTVLWRP